jgi:CHAT domain-containing protein
VQVPNVPAPEKSATIAERALATRAWCLRGRVALARGDAAAAFQALEVGWGPMSAGAARSQILTYEDRLPFYGASAVAAMARFLEDAPPEVVPWARKLKRDLAGLAPAHLSMIVFRRLTLDPVAQGGRAVRAQELAWEMRANRLAVGIALALGDLEPKLNDLAFLAALTGKGRALRAASGLQAFSRGSRNPLVSEGSRQLARVKAARAQGRRPPDDRMGVEAGEDAMLGIANMEGELLADLVDPAAVRRAVPRDATLIELARAPGRLAPDDEASDDYAAILIRPGAPTRVVRLGPVAEVDGLVDELLAAIHARRSDTRAIARRLDHALFEPLAEALGARRRVLLSLDGKLALLPFAALVGPDLRYRIQDWEFSYLTSGADLVAASAPRRRGRAVVLMDPDFDAGPVPPAGGGARAAFARLPGAAREGADVGALLPGAQLLRGPAASEQALLGVHGPWLLHVATHGFFRSSLPAAASEGARGFWLSPLPTTALARAEDALVQSGLALAGANHPVPGGDDGLVTALEVEGMDLRGTELVVVSACESGAGQIRDGEGVYGLRRAFQIAGARSSVLTLWSVDDDETAALMHSFYRRLAAGAPRSRALRLAQLELLGASAQRPPARWAPYFLAGNPGPLGLAPPRR